MIKRTRLPIALTIAGSDSGGGAGIQADLKTFAALGMHGTSAITCITAQNPRGVRRIQACRPELVRKQIEAVFDELPPAAVKTGMLFSAPIIHEVTQSFRTPQAPPLIVDPVMIATSGAQLLKPSAIRALKKLLPLAALVTPNVDEAELLMGQPIKSVEDLRAAARWLWEKFGCTALVKGGHLRGGREAIDLFFDGRDELLLSAPFVRGISTHGTGCTYSAAITAYLARGLPLGIAVQRGKTFITQAIAQSVQAANHTALNCFWKSP